MQRPSDKFITKKHKIAIHLVFSILALLTVLPLTLLLAQKSGAILGIIMPKWLILTLICIVCAVAIVVGILQAKRGYRYGLYLVFTVSVLLLASLLVGAFDDASSGNVLITAKNLICAVMFSAAALLLVYSMILFGTGDNLQAIIVLCIFLLLLATAVIFTFLSNFLSFGGSTLFTADDGHTLIFESMEGRVSGNIWQKISPFTFGKVGYLSSDISANEHDIAENIFCFDEGFIVYLSDISQTFYYIK